MTPQVTFKSLWLASERDRKARKIQLDSPKVLLLGTNGTGKSRVTKNIFWALGCEPPKRNAGSWDPDTIAALEFSLDGRSLIALRVGKAQGLFTADGKVLFASSNHGAWSAFTGQLFGYRLKLQRPGGNTYHPAGIDYLAVPFYIDQDGSWATTWATFTNLTQFQNWKTPFFASFTGQRPNAYLEAKQRRDEAKGRLTGIQKELEAQQKAFRRVRETLPKNLPSLDLTSFRAELAELASKARKVQQSQVDVRAKLLAAINQRQSLESELKLASASHRELVEDITYLSDIPDSTNIECPTCGTLHQTSFHARLSLAGDADSMAAFVSELNKQFEALRKKEVTLRQELRDIESNVARFDKISQEKTARLKLDEVLTSHSKRTLDRAFREVSQTLVHEVDELQEEVDDLNEVVKQYEDRARLAQVSEYYAAKLRYLSDTLNIPQDERVDETKLGSRPRSGGSSGPRAILAVHLATIATNVEYGDTVRFPFVVDTPQQSGQDEENLRRMITVMEGDAGANHQLILAVERLPENTDVSTFKVLNFDVKQGVLRKEDFDEASAALQTMVRELKARVAAADLKTPTEKQEDDE
jgi:predicted  nucleic acid-binding Zn-ribbon protein